MKLYHVFVVMGFLIIMTLLVFNRDTYSFDDIPGTYKKGSITLTLMHEDITHSGGRSIIQYNNLEYKGVWEFLHLSSSGIIIHVRWSSYDYKKIESFCDMIRSGMYLIDKKGFDTVPLQTGGDINLQNYFKKVN